MLICIEGLTNSGKTSVCKQLTTNTKYTYVNDMMQKNFVLLQLKKITNPIENIQIIDANTELLLYCSILSEKAFQTMKASNDIVVDRFSLSVYSYFQSRYQFDNDMLYRIVQFSSRNIVPDITFFLDVPLNVILERASQSPLSRKDIGIEKYYSDIRKSCLNNLKTFSKEYHIIDSNSHNIVEVCNIINNILRGIQYV